MKQLRIIKCDSRSILADVKLWFVPGVVHLFRILAPVLSTVLGFFYKYTPTLKKSKYNLTFFLKKILDFKELKKIIYF